MIRDSLRSSKTATRFLSRFEGGGQPDIWIHLSASRWNLLGSFWGILNPVSPLKFHPQDSMGFLEYFFLRVLGGYSMVVGEFLIISFLSLLLQVPEDVKGFF